MTIRLRREHWILRKHILILTLAFIHRFFWVELFIIYDVRILMTLIINLVTNFRMHYHLTVDNFFAFNEVLSSSIFELILFLHKFKNCVTRIQARRKELCVCFKTIFELHIALLALSQPSEVCEICIFGKGLPLENLQNLL